MSPTPKAYAGDTVTAGETALPWRHLTLPQAIARALRELRERDSRKVLAPRFDGRDGREVGETTVSRWITEPTRFPAHCLPVLLVEHAEFRDHFLQLLIPVLVTDTAILERLSAKAKAEYQSAVERVIVEQVKPGVWGRR